METYNIIYVICIQYNTIYQSYNKFQNELACFTQYLHKTGTYSAIRSTLKAKVITLLDQKFKTDVRDTSIDSVDNQVLKIKLYRRNI